MESGGSAWRPSALRAPVAIPSPGAKRRRRQSGCQNRETSLSAAIRRFISTSPIYLGPWARDHGLALDLVSVNGRVFAPIWLWRPATVGGLSRLIYVRTTVMQGNIPQDKELLEYASRNLNFTSQANPISPRSSCGSKSKEAFLSECLPAGVENSNLRLEPLRFKSARSRSEPPPSRALLDPPHKRLPPSARRTRAGKCPARSRNRCRR